MKKNRGRLLAEIGVGRFCWFINTGFFRPKCAKTRLEASKVSKFFPGLHPPTPVNKSKRKGWEGKVAFRHRTVLRVAARYR
jgi:hypothetical protein